MPRGTIHEAIAQEEFSTHVTISIYQKYSMKSLLHRVVPRLLESAFSQDILYRRGLPLRMCEKLGSYAALQQDMPSSGSGSGSNDRRNGSSSSSSSSGGDIGNLNGRPDKSIKHWREDFCQHVKVGEHITCTQLCHICCVDVPSTTLSFHHTSLYPFTHLNTTSERSISSTSNTLTNTCSNTRSNNGYMQALLALLPDMLTTELLDESADEITGDFVMHRLPPPCDINDPSSSPSASPSNGAKASTSSGLSMDSVVSMVGPYKF